MNRITKTALATVAGVSLLTAGTASAATENMQPNDTSASNLTPSEQNSPGTSLAKKVSNVQGVFTFEQDSTTPNSRISTLFRKSAATLCNATDDFAEANPLEWKIEISGNVSNPCVIDVGEAMETDSVKSTMTCTCGGNPTNGAAIYNADLKGIPVMTLIGTAEPEDGVNTITFTSTDGRSVSVPLGYAVGRHAIISYELNGEDLSSSVGGNNQLFMSSTAASYLLRDVVDIEVTKETNPPTAPGSNDWDVYPNRPNVGVMESAVS